MIIFYDNVVGKSLLDFLAGLIVFFLVTGSSYIFIICSFTGIDIVSLQIATLLCVHGFIMMTPLFKAADLSQMTN